MSTGGQGSDEAVDPVPIVPPTVGVLRALSAPARPVRPPDQRPDRTRVAPRSTTTRVPPARVIETPWFAPSTRQVASGVETTVARLAERPLAELPGAGPLSALLVDPAVTDVLVNGDQVWVDRGAGLVRCDVPVGSAPEVRRLAQRLAAACGRRLDEGCPYVDARLPDGTRLHAVLPPIAAAGPYLSLRTFRHRAFSIADLRARGTLCDVGADLVTAILAARLSFLVSGGTGSGKTTLLASLLGLVPSDQRIVIVEDAAELRPDHPHAVGLQARTANVEGSGAVSLRDLLREALRMRPDRLVVGECRGAEVVDLMTVHKTNSGLVISEHETPASG